MTVFGIDPSFTATGVSDGTEHVIIAAPKADEGEERAHATMRRADVLATTIAAWISGRIGRGAEAAAFVEAPMLSSTAGAGHLYELGWLMAMLYFRLSRAGVAPIVEVETAKLRKMIGLAGNAPKTLIPLTVYKRFGVEFDRDPGADKAFAYLLHRYGLAVAAGEIGHVAAPPRGQGTKARGSVRKTARAR